MIDGDALARRRQLDCFTVGEEGSLAQDFINIALLKIGVLPEYLLAGLARGHMAKSLRLQEEP